VKPYYADRYATLYHGDALEVLPELDLHGIAACITDPPYLIGAASAGSINSKVGTWADAMNAAHWFSAWYRMVNEALRHDGAFWSFLNWRTLPVVMRASIDARLPMTSVAVWDKEWIGPGGQQGLRPSYEMVALMAKPGFAVKDRGVADVIRAKVGSYKPNGHPAEKPTSIVSRIYEISGNPDIVLDPFIGSGTTAVVAKAHGARCIGIDADERWCEVAASRLAQDVLFDDAA
jgi:DNA modification methylase